MSNLFDASDKIIRECEEEYEKRDVEFYYWCGHCEEGLYDEDVLIDEENDEIIHTHCGYIVERV
jgi:hypothetical protein